MNYFRLRDSDPSAIKEDFLLQEFHNLFKYFEASMINLTKTEMHQTAIKNGWMDIMEITHFCFNPDLKIRPCGKCSPCSQAIGESMSWRIPLHGKLNWLLYRCKTTIKHDLLKL